MKHTPSKSLEPKALVLPSSNDLDDDHRGEAPRAAILNITENLNALIRDIWVPEDHYLHENESGSTQLDVIRPK